MDPRLKSALITGGLALAIGAYVTLYGYRVLGKRPGQDAFYDQWHQRYGPTLRRGGPLIMILGLLSAFVRLASPK
jgi:hypothetical protein